MNLKIIISDSDKQSERLMSNILSSAGYDVCTAQSISEIYPMVTADYPDIIIIDPLYPLKDSVNLIKNLREWNQCAIIAVSSNVTESAIIDILDAGADDYIKKPFFSSELLVRVRTAERHIKLIKSTKGMSTDRFYKCGDLTVEFDRHLVTVCNKHVHLTKNEFKILTLLCQYSGKVLTYDFIMKSIWGPQATGNNGILRVNITNLRKKIEQDSLNPLYLFTENGIGYRISESQNS